MYASWSFRRSQLFKVFGVTPPAAAQTGMLAPVHAAAMIFRARPLVSAAGRPRPSCGITGISMGPGSVSSTGKWIGEGAEPFVSRSAGPVVETWVPFRSRTPGRLACNACRLCSRTSMKSPRLIASVTANGVWVSRSGQLAHTGARARILASYVAASESCLKRE